MSTAVDSSGPGLRASLACQARVLYALMMREVITRFGRQNLGVLWLVAEPMMFTLGVAALWSAAGLGHRTGVAVVPFAVTGYTSVLMWRNTVGRCNAAVVQNLNLLYHANVKVLDIFLTRIVLEVAGSIASFALISTVLVVGEWMPMPEDFLKIIAGLALLAWFSGALALCVGAAASLSEVVDRVWHPLSYVLLPLSGAVFLVDWLPTGAREFVLLLPMVHCLELLREGYFGESIRAHYDVAYTAGFCLCLTLAGLALIRIASRRTEGL